jgi:uroporphyrinogen decarboxylase
MSPLNKPDTTVADGIHAMVPREQMHPSARKLRDVYAMTPGAPLFQKEFGYFCLDEWRKQGLDAQADLPREFCFDEPATVNLGGLGWCEPGYWPFFEEKVLEVQGPYEIVQDFAGRHVKCFAGRRSGFMPEYVDHVLKDRKTWEEQCLWRLDPEAPGRFDKLPQYMAVATAAPRQGKLIVQRIAGAGMYLRAMLGVENMMLAFYDMPDVIHDAMRAWLKLAQAVTARHQQQVTLDEVFFAEDICYNHGSLVSPSIFAEFFFPYYQELLKGIRARQLDPSRHLYVQVDTDGFCVPVIDLYHRAIGLDVMSPFEVASGCDVVEIGRQFPYLVMSGGIDKRVLARGPKAIDEMLDRILPVMRARGGYTPTCDHGVPAEVTLANYRYYRQRALDLGSR